MLLPATNFHLPYSPSSLFVFPHLFPIRKTQTKYLLRCSASDTPTPTRTRTSSPIKRIAERLRSLGITEPTPTPAPTPSPSDEIHVAFPHELPKRSVGHAFEPSWTTPLNPVPLPGSGIAVLSRDEVARQRNVKEEELQRRKVKVPTLAELSLPDSEIRRLTTLGFRSKQKVRVAKAGITERIVNVIHERWRHSEVVRIVCEDLCMFDLRRTHDLLEKKTGGLVVWRSGRTIILYRGADYKCPYFLQDDVKKHDNTGDALQYMGGDDKICDERESLTSETNSGTSAMHDSNAETAQPALLLGVGTPNIVRFQLPGEAELTEDADYLLKGLGPRFTDWWGYDPQPIDGDLLPAFVHGYRKPFRLLPYGVKPKLTDDEMTTLKRLGRPLPCHFALGKNRKLHGLAAAIIKLWERCEIAKIAVKRGVRNTSSNIMAKELKCLTGGILLSRDREFIVLYRGKDFLPAAVSSAIRQRRNIGIHNLNAAVSTSIKQRRNRSIGTYQLKPGNSSPVTFTLGQNDGTIKCDSKGNGMTFQKDTKHRMLTKAEGVIKRTSIKLAMALEKKAKAEKLLVELENVESPQVRIDKEGITKEERYMLRRIGLKMKPFLLLGRRGVFDGTMENIHLHWKYRELSKIICKGNHEDVEQLAWTLEAESGGILVAVERVSKGYAIILYRGKNYRRPACLRPQTLLNKKQALKRSIEAQRCESLKCRILQLDKKINELKLKMVDVKEHNSEQIAEVLRFDLEHPVELIDGGGAYQDEPENSINWNSPEEASVDNQQAMQEDPAELIDGGGAYQYEPENSVNWNSSQETSVDNQLAIQEHPIELIDGGGAYQDEPENFINWNSPEEASFDNQKAIKEHPIKLIVDGADQGEPEKNSINWNSLKEASVDSQQEIQKHPVKLDGAHQGKPENSINWNSLEEASVHKQAIQEHPVVQLDDGGAHHSEPENFVNLTSKNASVYNQQGIQVRPVELIDGRGAHQGEPESWPDLVHKKRLLDGVNDSGVDTEHCVSNSKAMESSISLSKSDSEPSAPLINMSSNELLSRSVCLSSKERLILRKQALQMIKEPVLAIGKSNIVSGVVKTIKAHFRKHPLAIVDVKGRAKGTSVQELVFKLEQETGAVLVSREPSKVILYRGWWAVETPSPAVNVNKVGQEKETMPSVSPASTLRVWNRGRRMSGKRRISRTGKRGITRTGSKSIRSSRR
ncbi:hypothetical protein RJT34_27838 [Clitoria ternatea]|uniref:CRM domain-containing protein n=1 Tax=Clitoria ternatea TaxID=43366 RepID=A0AAN9FGY2_CLITE